MQSIREQRGSDALPPEFNTDEFRAICKEFITPKQKFLERIMASANSVAECLCNIFTMKEFWQMGRYSDALLDAIFFLIHRCRALEQLLPAKKGLVNDISMLIKFVNDDEFKERTGTVRFKLFTADAITKGIIDAIVKSKIWPDLMREIFYFCYRYIRARLEKSDFIFPEMQYAYVDGYVFMIRLYKGVRRAERGRLKAEFDFHKGVPALTKADRHREKSYRKAISKMKVGILEDDAVAFTQTLFAVFPNVPEYMEFTEIVEAGVWKKSMTLRPNANVKKSSTVEVPAMAEQLEILRKAFRDFSLHMSELASVKEGDEGLPQAAAFGKLLCEQIPRALHDIGSGLNRIRERLSLRLLHPPRSDEKLSNYEKSMRIGLRDDLNMFLLLLNMCRLTKELLQANLPQIVRCITVHIQKYIQNFVYFVLPQTVLRNAKPVCDIAQMIRALLGDFSLEDFQIERKVPQHPPRRQLSSAPHLDLIELVRIQLSLMTNPESEFVTKKRVHSADIMHFRQFLNDTRFFIDLLNISDTIETVCDQSSLFFKEYFLEAEGLSFFPVTSSLPVILSEYALKNYYRPELTGAIFYPLSIYDDAASAALRVFKCRFLFEEIKVEARICLTSITRKISESSYHPIRRFASLRSLSSSLVKNMKDIMAQDSLQEGVSALKMGVLLQQNQLYLLGTHIDTKCLIADRMNEILHESMTNVLHLTEKHGALAAIAVSSLFDMVESTHRLLMMYGLPLMPYSDLLSMVLCTDTPNSMQSLLLVNIAHHLLRVNSFSLLTTPLRLIPKKPVKLDVKAIYHGSIGEVFQRLFEPTMCFLSVQNFRALFWLLSDGAIAILHNQVLGILVDAYRRFAQRYSVVKDRMVRIKDAPISMSCIQVVDRFEGAYRYFLDDREIMELFDSMAEIGNILAISEMMDDAFMLKQQAAAQTAAFFRSETANYKPEVSDFFTLFDKRFQATRPFFENLTSLPTQGEVVQPFLYAALLEMAERVAANRDFDETSARLLDMTSLKGFAAVWSVLYFLFVLIEEGKDRTGGKGSLERFGEGVLLCAASVLLITRQKTFARAVGIGERLLMHSATDFSGVKGARMKRLFEAEALVRSSYDVALSTFEPAVELIIGSAVTV
jgi:hypothetical protein